MFNFKILLRMKKIFFYALSLMCSISAQAAVITYSYDGEKTEAENGTALQAAIAAAESGDELKVQAGTYVGNFSMKEGVNVSGGWDANFETQTDYATILDANASGRVVNQEAAFTTLTIWSNLTIQNGNLAEAGSQSLGSGVALKKKGQVKHCEIRNNTFSYQANCIGGGVGEDDTPDSNTEVMVDDCWIHHNCATHGGGVRIRGTIQNSIIENNNTKDVKAGPCGGVHLQAGRMIGCVVRGNLSGGDTGGVRALGKCDVINNLIHSNTATGKVGGLSIESALSNVIGNTIVKNNQIGNTGSQAGVRIDPSKTNNVFNLQPNGTFFVNNVVWGNMSNGVAEAQNVYYISRYDKSAGQRSYNAIIGQKGDDSAETSIQLTADDPGFADAEHGDFSLLYTSALLNFGNNDKATVAKDLAGNNRIAGTTVDLGAYELPYITLTIAAFEHATLTAVGPGELVAGDYPLPMGYTTTATIVAEEGYNIQSVTCGDAILVADEGIYTLPALLTDMTLTITVEKSTATGINDANTTTKTVKVIRNGQLFIIRDGKTFNVIGSQM